MSMISELVEELIDNADSYTKELHDLMYRAANTIEALSEKEREPKQGEWTPCSERPPKRQGYYICTCKDGSKNKRTTAVKWSNGWQLTGARAYWIVLAWMPLPDPWEGADHKTEPQIIACPLQEEDADYARWLYEDEPQNEFDDKPYLYRDIDGYLDEWDEP